MSSNIDFLNEAFNLAEEDLITEGTTRDFHGRLLPDGTFVDVNGEPIDIKAIFQNKGAFKGGPQSDYSGNSRRDRNLGQGSSSQGSTDGDENSNNTSNSDGKSSYNSGNEQSGDSSNSDKSKDSSNSDGNKKSDSQSNSDSNKETDNFDNKSSGSIDQDGKSNVDSSNSSTKQSKQIRRKTSQNQSNSSDEQGDNGQSQQGQSGSDLSNNGSNGNSGSNSSGESNSDGDSSDNSSESSQGSNRVPPTKSKFYYDVTADKFYRWTGKKFIATRNVSEEAMEARRKLLGLE